MCIPQHVCGEESIIRCLQLYNFVLSYRYMITIFMLSVDLIEKFLVQNYHKKVFEISTDGSLSSYYVWHDNNADRRENDKVVPTFVSFAHVC